MNTSRTTKKLQTVWKAVCAVAALIAVNAHSAVLTFDGNICEPGGATECFPGSNIGTTYGSIADRLDVVFASRSGAADGSIVNEHLRLWTTGFGDLVNVGYAALAGGGQTQVGEISFRPRSGYAVTLTSFDLAPWIGGGTSRYVIYDSSYNVLASEGPFDLTAGGHRTISVGMTRNDGIIVQWGPDSFNVGIDNVSFSVSAVPEPGQWVMIAAGLSLLVGRRIVKPRRLR